MPKIYELDGKQYHMPDDVTDDEALAYLGEVNAPPLWSDVVKAVPGTVNRGIVKGVSGMTRALGDITGSETLQEVGRSVNAGINAEAEEQTPKNMTFGQEAVLSGLSSAGQMLPVAAGAGLGVAAAGMTGPAALAASMGIGTTVMGANTGFTRYGEVRDAGFAPLRAGAHGLFEGLVEKYTEYLPMKELLKGGKLAREAVKYLGKELGGEEIATLLQDVSAKLSDRPEMTVGDYLHDAAITAVSTPIAGGAQYAAFKGVGALLPAPVGGEITAENSEGAPPLPPTAASPPATVPAVPPAPLSPAAPATPAASTSIKDLLGVPIPGVGEEKSEEPKILARSKFNLDEDQHEVTYLHNPDGTINRVTKTSDGSTFNEVLIARDDGTQVWAMATQSQEKGIPVVLNIADAGPTVRADIADLRSQEAGNPTPSPSAAKRERTITVTQKGTTDGQDEETGQTAEEVLGGEQVGSPTATDIPLVITKTYGDQEVSNVYKVFRDGRMQEIRLPDTEHMRLRHLGRLINDRRGAKTAKRQAKLSLEIDALRQEVANHFGFAVGEVDGLAESYQKAVVDSFNRGERAVGTVFNVLGLNKTAVTESRDITPKRAPEVAALPPAGKVQIAPQFANDPYAQRSAKYLEGWIRTFSPNMRVVILEVMPPAAEGQPPKAGSTFYENGVHYVRLGSLNPAIKSKAIMVVLDLAHEFGHMLVQEHLHLPRFAAVLKQIQADHAALVAKIPTMTVEDFLNEWSNPGHTVAMREFEALMGVARTEPAQVLIDSVNARMGDPNYFLSFDEFAAEQFARYVNAHQKIGFDDSVKSMWAEAMAVVKEFYDKVVKKLGATKSYERFVDDLRGLAKVVETQRSDPAAQGRGEEHAAVDMALQDLSKSYNYTMKVISRLPKKDVLKKATVLAEVGRNDVNPQERDLIEDVLHDLPDVFDRQLFEFNVLSKVTQLKLQVLYKTQYNSYGWTRLQFNGNPVQYEPKTQYQPDSGVRASAENQKKQWALLGRPWMESHIWQVPFHTGYNPHFAEASNYWAHTRVLLEDGGRTIGEVQSDVEQSKVTRDALADRAFVISQLLDELVYVNTPENYATFERSTKNLGDDGFWLPDYGTREEFFDNWPEDRENIAKELTAKSEDLAEQMDVKDTLAEANMPGKWFRVVLRSETVEAAKNGESWVRLPSIETLIQYEGWKTIPKEGVYTLKGLEGYKTLDGQTLTGQVQVDVLAQISVETEENGFLSLPERAVALDAISVGMIYSQTPRLIDDKKHQAIADKYRKEIIPFVNKEFKAVYTTDEFGQTWWQWQVNPELASKPIEYFQADLANQAAVDEVTKTANLAAFPRAFEHVQDLMNSILQLNQMAKMLPNIEGLQKYRRLMQGMHNLKNSLMEQPNQQIQRWHSMNIKQAELTEDALRQEERDGAHWTTVVKDTALDNMGNTKEVWVHRPNPEFLEKMKALGIHAEGVTLFLSIKNDFLRVLQTMEETLSRSVAELFKGNYMLQQAKLNAVREEFARLRLIPYLPDTRFGNYSIQVKAGHEEVVEGRKIKKGEIVYYEKFESQRDRDARFEELNKVFGKAHKVVKFYEDDVVASMQMMPKTFVETAIQVLNSNPDTALTEEQTNLMLETQYDFTATGKFEKYLKVGRKGVGGAEKDLRRVYANYMWRTANSISKMQYGKALQGAIADVSMEAQETRKETGDSTALDKLKEYLGKNFQYVMRPQNEWQGLRAFVSLWYLIGSPKTAIMNFMSVPVLSYSYLGARYGDVSATTSIMRATKLVAQFWKNPEKVPLTLRLVLQQAKADGVTDQSFAAMLANVAEGGVALEKLLPKYGFLKNRKMSDAARKLTWRITSMGMAPFRVVEQINRMVTLLATYELEAKKLGAKTFSQDAYNAARDAVDYTQNEFSPWNRPQFMQGKKGVFLIFYSYVQNMAFMLFGGDKGWWRALLVLMAMGGLQGLPGMDNLIDMLNWAGRKMTGQNVDLRTEAREVADAIGANPDLVMHGFSHSLFGLGWDVSNSAGVGRIIPGTDAIFGVGKFEHRFLQAAGEVGGPAASLAISFLQALADDNPNALLRFDRVLPPALRNLERATRAYEQSAWVDGNGNPIVRDPTAVEVVGQALGFTPTRKSEVQERLRVERDVVQFYTVARQELLGAAFQAKRSGELDAWLDAQEAINKFNDKVPFPELRIIASAIASSTKSRGKAEKEALENDSPQKRYQRMYDAIGPLYNLEVDARI